MEGDAFERQACHYFGKYLIAAAKEAAAIEGQNAPDIIGEEVALMLSDIVPTGLEVGVMNSDVQFGDVVAIVGAGPVGLAALLAVQFFSPAKVIVVDLDE